MEDASDMATEQLFPIARHILTEDDFNVKDVKIALAKEKAGVLDWQ